MIISLLNLLLAVIFFCMGDYGNYLSIMYATILFVINLEKEKKQTVDFLDFLLAVVIFFLKDFGSLLSIVYTAINIVIILRNERKPSHEDGLPKKNEIK